MVFVKIKNTEGDSFVKNFGNWRILPCGGVGSLALKGVKKIRRKYAENLFQKIRILKKNLCSLALRD